ncbi:MAG: peptidoglycan DD-metalloendopeptidase family protein [bacterium]
MVFRKITPWMFPGHWDHWRTSLNRPWTLRRLGVAALLPVAVGVFLLSGISAAGTAGALTSAELKKRISGERARLVRLKRRLKSQKKRIVRAERAERSILEEIEGLDAQLEILGGEVRIRNYRLALARQRLADAERERRAIEHRMSKAETELRRRIRSLYKGVGASPALLAWLEGGVAEAARMRVYARRIAQADARLMRSVQKERSARARVMEVIRSEAQGLEQQKQEVEAEDARLRAARNKKRGLLASIRKRRERQRQLYRELRGTARRLQKLLTHWVSKAEGSLLRTFHDRKGLLPWPVSGRIIGRFDPIQRTSASALTSGAGITLAARRGEPVRSVGRGRVIYADRLRGYGNLLVLDHGGSFYTVYAHGTLPSVRVGERVEEGQNITQVGEGGALGRPAIYFEVRHRGKPEDPVGWLRVRTP